MGIWLLSQYLNSGAKHDIQLVELGPGRGTLMDDVLRVRYSTLICRAFFKPISDTITIITFSHICQARSPRGIKSSSSSCSGEETSGMGWQWQKRSRITLAPLRRGYSHDGWCIHHAGCARVFRRTPVSSYRSTPPTLVPLSDLHPHRKVIKVGKRS